MSDEKLNVVSKQVGRKVAFVGGPNAGQARVIPESAGEFVATDDYVYRIVPFSMASTKETLYFAFDAQKHPIRLLFEMWEEYSVAAQLRGGAFGHVNRQGSDLKSRS